MPYRYLDNIAIADVAFEARGETLEEVFIAAAEATLNVMVRDLNSVESRERRTVRVQADALDLLLFDFLQELIFYKDSGCLLLRVEQIAIARAGQPFSLKAEVFGERINPQKHELLADVKAVTLHRFQLEETEKGWKANVILDI